MQSLRSFSKNAIMQMCELIVSDNMDDAPLSGLAATVRKGELIAIAGLVTTKPIAVFSLKTFQMTAFKKILKRH